MALAVLATSQVLAASSLTDFQAASKKVVNGPYVPGKQTAPVAIYHDGGTKYAIVDATGSTDPVKLGNALDEYGLEYVDIVKRVPRSVPAKPSPARNGTMLTGPKKNDPENVVEPADVGVNYNYWLRWWEPWFKEFDLSNDNDSTSRAGVPAIGCENENLPPFPCTISQTAKASASASSRLTIQQLLELGFEIGVEVEEEVSAEVEAKPGYHYELEPRVRWYREYWSEKREQYKCGIEYSWQWWCSGDPFKIGEQSRTGTARRPDEFYGRVRQRPIND